MIAQSQQIKSTIRLRRRAALTETLPELNNLFVSCFNQVNEIKSPDWDKKRPYFGFSGESSVLAYGNMHKADLSAQIICSPRFASYMERDKAQYDDVLILDFTSAFVERKLLFYKVLPKISEFFCPYRGSITDDRKVDIADFDKVRDLRLITDRDIDGRDSVLRIWPVSYFDEILCQRAFGIGAAEVVARAAPACEHAALVNGGAYLIVTTEPVTGLDLDVLNARLMGLIAGTMSP